MTRQPGAIAAARALNALFFLAVAAYCFLAYTPFAYDAFINPSVVPAVWGVFSVAPAFFWAALLTTSLTLMPQLSTPGARGRALAWSYVAAGLAAGVVVSTKPVLANIGNTPRAVEVGMAALIWPVWLATIDHRIWPAPGIRRADPFRLLTTCLLSAVFACGVYALAAPWQIRHAVGVDLSPGMFAVAIGCSLILTLFVFMALFLAVMTAKSLAEASGPNAAAEYWLMLALLMLCTAAVLYGLVFVSLAFRGPVAAACATAMALAIASVWADVAWLRSRAGAATLDALTLFGAPVAGIRSSAAAIVVLAVLPLMSYSAINAVRQFDWNFVLQKLSVLVVWLLTFVCAYAAVGTRRPRGAWSIWRAAAPIAAFALYHAVGWLSPVAIDRYSAIDPSLRLIRDARTAQSSQTAAHYAFLRSQTLVLSPPTEDTPIDFVRSLGPAAGRKPNIFLFVIDSLRRDYLSVYNPKVPFTPEIAKLAADSFVYERAWTRYAGTLLSVPAIWAGGMVPHMVRQPSFRPRNTLLKLLDANHYRRLLDMDSVVQTLDLRDEQLVELNLHDRRNGDDFCDTTKTLERLLPHDRSRPVFVYSLPQNIHTGGWRLRTVPAGETYPPGFVDQVASAVRNVDRCLGNLVDFLKREQIYDDSVIIVTADHGDLLGEDGRWGHAFWLYPEVMKIPLIVHVPSWLKPSFRTDLDAVVYTTDITPSLYALLGYQPEDLGPLFGRSFFTSRNADSFRRRREASLVASSYGAVYGMVSRNGRRMDVVDTVDAAEYALDLDVGRRLTVTPSMMAQTRQAIAEQLGALAARYHYANDAP